MHPRQHGRDGEIGIGIGAGDPMLQIFAMGA